ncbi:MAG TPA: WD40 repeat domain-containing protein, partial [Acidimicrobiales bacterium]|nr:WD40 repeat domain-containing protein [Acidimicrobiales bacterium]
HTGLPLFTFAVDATGTTAIAGTTDGRVAKIDLSNGKVQTVWQASDRPALGFEDSTGVLYAVPQDDPRLLSRDFDGTEHVLLSDAVVNPVAKMMALTRYTDAAGHEVSAVATADEIRVMTAQGDVVRTFPVAGVDVLSFSGDGTRLAIGTGLESLGSMLTFTVVNAETGDPVGPALTLPWGIYDLDRQGRRLAVSNLVQGQATLIDVDSGATLSRNRDMVDASRFAFSADSTRVAHVGTGGVIQVLDAETGSQLGQDVVENQQNKVGLGFGPNGEDVFTAEQGGNIAEVGIGARTKLSRQLDSSGFLAFWSPDGKTLAVPSVPANDHIALVDRDSGKVRKTLINPQPYDNWKASGMTQAAYNPAGTEVAIGSVAMSGKPAAVFVFSVDDGQLLRRLDVPDVARIGQPLAWSQDGETIAAGAPGRILFLDAKNGSFRAEAFVPEIQFSINGGFDDKGRFVTTGLPFGVTLVFDEHGQRLASYGSPSDPRIGFELPGDRLVFTNQSSGEVQIVGLLDGKPRGALFSGASVAFAAPLNEHLGWAESSVGAITLWDPATGEQVGDPFVATDHPPQTSVFPSPDGRYLAAGGDHLTLWDMDPAVWRQRACEAAGRNLTRAEWTRYLPEGEPYHVTCPQYPSGEAA